MTVPSPGKVTLCVLTTRGTRQPLNFLTVVGITYRKTTTALRPARKVPQSLGSRKLELGAVSLACSTIVTKLLIKQNKNEAMRHRTLTIPRLIPKAKQLHYPYPLGRVRIFIGSPTRRLVRVTKEPGQKCSAMGPAVGHRVAGRAKCR